MNFRTVSIVVTSLICLASLAGALVQGRQLAALRTEHQNLLAQPPTRDTVPASPREPPGMPVPTGPHAVASPSLELLRLRAEVTRLTNRRRELAGVDNENERLRAQLAAGRTNADATVALPPGYIRKSSARFLGYATPDATLESFLWALQNRDFTNILQTFTPESAKEMQQQFGPPDHSPEDFFKQGAGVPGMRVLDRKPGREPDAYELQLEMVPGLPTETIIFRLINGQWKMQTH